ncbi:MAG: hypothetical protein UY96_C0003G0048 [Parcubacteria group bacterium GW2011_GWB1_56_8]|nr:MAG: hypothetical protein UY96_C0003G0048 [Parcubacteria group bacterium GW2011_GWB1_56_8]
MREKVDAETFIKTWQEGDSIMEIAKDLGVKETYVKNRAGMFRQKGVPLKKFRSRVALDIEGLAALAAKYGPTASVSKRPPAPKKSRK